MEQENQEGHLFQEKLLFQEKVYEKLNYGYEKGTVTELEIAQSVYKMVEAGKLHFESGVLYAEKYYRYEHEAAKALAALLMQEEKEPEQKHLDGTEEKTFELNAALLEVMGDQEFKKFLEEHMEVFEGRNRKLYKFLEEYFKLEERNINSLVDDEKLKMHITMLFTLKAKRYCPQKKSSDCHGHSSDHAGGGY